MTGYLNTQALNHNCNFSFRNMSKEANEAWLRPEITDVAASENVKIQIIYPGGKMLRIGYDIENRKRLQQGLLPALMRMVYQETSRKRRCN
jgi:hypothetical protein